MCIECIEREYSRDDDEEADDEGGERGAAEVRLCTRTSHRLLTGRLVALLC